MSALRIIGVRHHSPACARLVRHAIAGARPWAVLIEGPSDMNERLDDLHRPHRLPIAIYSYELPATSGARAHGSWSPFCAYSPEWVALTEGNAAGALVRFIDLPAWDPAFADVENRYSDHELGVSRTLAKVAVERGFDSTDALWDHLFELTVDPVQLERDLAEYFDGLRGRVGEREGGGRDVTREAYMARWIDWAMHEAPSDATVLVVCGGYHKPALHALAGTTAQTTEPEVPIPAPEIARTGSYLVPFSFHRLDSFTGYASGMPSPAFYEEAWHHGDAAAERMMFNAIARLRTKGQRVSTADAIAVGQMTHGLARLRGHRVPTRTDVLDGLAGTLIKEALRAPPPWSTRAPLPPGTEPYLVEILRAFSGERRGALAPGTTQPPLVGDIETTCAAEGLPFDEKPAKVAIDVFDPAARARRQVLYRLAWLELPGVELVTPADLRRGRSQPIESWRLVRDDLTTAAMIERAVYGASLEAAALARITEQLDASGGVVELARHLERALRAGYHHLAGELCAAAADAANREPMFSAAGEALRRLAQLSATEPLPPGHGLGALVRVVAERALWLLEAIDGADKRFDRPTVDGIAALRAALDLELPDHAALASACTGVWSRRLAAPDAPPAVRGACLGALWTFSAQPASITSAAEAAVRGTPSAVLGDLLGGLFALAREAFRESALLDVVDARLEALTDREFLSTLPALRRAFAYFPPGERRDLAKWLAARHRSADASALLDPVAEPDAAAKIEAMEVRWFEVAARYRLLEDR